MSVFVTILASGAPPENKNEVARRCVESYVQATKVWNPSDPVAMEVDAVRKGYSVLPPYRGATRLFFWVPRLAIATGKGKDK